MEKGQGFPGQKDVGNGEIRGREKLPERCFLKQKKRGEFRF